MSSYSEFYLNCPAKIMQFEALEIYHPNFTKTYRVVRNKVGGLTATIDGTPQLFDYYPLRITSKGTRADLDFALQITLGELGEIIPNELDAVAEADGWQTKPRVRYWTFRSDLLTSALFGPIVLEVVEFPQTRTGTSFVAQAPSLNNNRCGELYLPERFPMLDAFL